MQTILVHFRHPRRLLREVGWKASMMMLAFLGGAVWSALINPVLWVVFLICTICSHGNAGTLCLLARLSGGTLIVANVLLALLSVQSDAGPSRWKLLSAVFSYPQYWLLISIAAYRALWQLILDPFRWEKTPHEGVIG